MNIFFLSLPVHVYMNNESCDRLVLEQKIASPSTYAVPGKCWLHHLLIFLEREAPGTPPPPPSPSHGHIHVII